MSQDFQVLCIYHNDRKLVIFEHWMSLEDFKKKLSHMFQIQNKTIKLIHIDFDAEITATLSIKENTKIQIVTEEVQVLNEVRVPLPRSEISNPSDPLDISFQQLIGKNYNKEALLEQINEWAHSKRFHLYFSEGQKSLAKGFKRTLSCTQSQCHYKLIMTSDEEGKNFSVYEKLSKKYTKHSKFTFSCLLIN